MVMQDTTQKAKQAMPELARMMWTGYAVHHCAMHSDLSHDASIGSCQTRKCRVMVESQLNHAGFSCAEGAGCSAYRPATGGRVAHIPPPLRLGRPSRQDAHRRYFDDCALQSLFIFASKGACS